MKYLDRDSLSATLDSLSEALFFQKKIPARKRTRAAEWIASRQGLPGAYAGMFAPTEKDGGGIRLFTGEPVCSRVGIAHLLGEEACRVLAMLNVAEPAVQLALTCAIRGMTARLEEADRRGSSTGAYCCGTCATGYWRNLALKLFPRAEERLRQGMIELKQARRGDGQWRRFPFYHTSLALAEIGPDLAKTELQYAAQHWRRILPRIASAEDAISRRRAAVGQRLVELCES